MSLPEELCKLRDEKSLQWVKKDDGSLGHCVDCYKCGFDAGAEAMRTYSQAKGEKQMPEENSITDLWSEITLLRFKNEGHEKMREWMQKEIDNYKAMQAEMDKLVEALEFYEKRSSFPLSQLGEIMEQSGSTFDLFTQYTKKAYEALASYRAWKDKNEVT